MRLFDFVAPAVIASALFACSPSPARAATMLSNEQSAAIIQDIAAGNEPSLFEKLRSDFDSRLSSGDTPMIVAAAKNKVSILRALVEKGAGVDVIGVRGWTPLMTAVFYGNVDAVDYLLLNGAKTDLQSEDGATAHSIAEWRGLPQLAAKFPTVRPTVGASSSDLINAVAAEDHERLTQLLAIGLKAGTTAEAIAPAFFIAAASGDLISLSALLRAGFTPDLSDSSGVTALMVATQQGRIDVMKFLLSVGSDPSRRVSSSGPSPLTIAEAMGNTNAILVLKSVLPATPQSKEDGFKRLLAAIAANDLSKVDAILKAGIRPAGIVINNRKIVPLSVAAFKGFSEIVERLLSAGANPNEPDDKGVTPLMSAIAGDHHAVADLIIGKPDQRHLPVNLNTMSYAGISAVMMARLAGWTQLGDLSLVMRKDFDKAIDQGDIATLKTMMERAVRENWITSKDEKGWNSLTRAASAGNPAVVSLLLSQGSFVETSDPQVPSPLMVAAATGKSDVVKVLLTNGADPLREDGAQKTAADMAAKAGYKDIVSQLRPAASAFVRRINAGLFSLGYLSAADDSWTAKSRDALATFNTEFPDLYTDMAPPTFGVEERLARALDHTIRVCNSTTQDTSLAVVFNPNENSATTASVTGWWTLRPGSCKWLRKSDADRMPGPIWMTAESDSLKWGGPEHLCLPESRRKMDHVASIKGSSCAAGTRMVGFWQITPGKSQNPYLLTMGR